MQQFSQRGLALLFSCTLSAFVGCGDGGTAQVMANDTVDLSRESDEIAPPIDDMGAPSHRTPWEETTRWYPANPIFCVQGEVEDDPLGLLFEGLGLESDLGIPRTIYEVFGGYVDADPGRRSWFHRLQKDALSIPCFSGQAAARADRAVDGDHTFTALIADAAAMVDTEVEVGGRVSGDAEECTLLALLDSIQGDANWGDRSIWSAREGELPVHLKATLKKILTGVVGAMQYRAQALSAISPALPLDVVFNYLPNSYLPSTVGRLDVEVPEVQAVMVPGARSAEHLYRGATFLAQALDEALLSSLVGSEIEESFELQTPEGWIMVRGHGDDVYDPHMDDRLKDPILLLMDLGGDDTYLIPAGANTSENNGISLHIDLGGNDFYKYPEVGSPHDQEGLLVSDWAGRYEGDDFWGNFSLSTTPRQGAGVLGYGFLIDLGEGADAYRTLRYGQGFGAYGVGLLYDDGGDDSYIMEAGGQGTGFSGLGLLVDHRGNDQYRAFYSAQGHGRPGGAGYLYDGRGDDLYTLEPSNPQVYNWFPGFEHNLSMGQGASTGARNLDANKVSLSGGFALLRDREGNDEYIASVMSQGEGYWMGMGILADASGDDRYNALVYSQGSSQHFAIGVFLEGGGDDVYNDVLPIQQALPGLSHDFSVSVFIEDGGDDIYRGASGSFGAGKCHGMAIFVDNDGDDEYQARNVFSLGWAKDFDGEVGSCGNWMMVPTYGLFVDSDGEDTYDKGDDDLGEIRQNAMWITDDPRDDTALELSGGVDATGTPSGLRAYGQVYFEEIVCEGETSAAEFCDGRDQDCDGQVDEGIENCEWLCESDTGCADGFCGADRRCFECPTVTVMVTDENFLALSQAELSEPQQTVRLDVETPDGRGQTLELNYNATCNDVLVRSVEERNNFCFDFNAGPCEASPEPNCSGYVRYRFNGKRGVLNDALACAESPEEQGWVQYHGEVRSCYPAYEGPTVDRFNVSLNEFPPCDDAVRGQAWCVSPIDQSPSRCLNCEESLYICR